MTITPDQLDRMREEALRLGEMLIEAKKAYDQAVREHRKARQAYFKLQGAAPTAPCDQDHE